MQITMNIDASQMSENLVDILKTLTENQRKEIAKETLLAWLKEPNDKEHSAYSREIINTIRADRWNEKYKTCSDLEIMETYDYKQKIKNFPTTKEIMVKTITQETIKFYQEEISKFIKKDETVRTILEITLAKIKDDFPKYIHDTLVHHFATELSALGPKIASAVFQVTRNSETIEQLQQNLAGKY
jgi:hypothetical protein